MGLRKKQGWYVNFVTCKLRNKKSFLNLYFENSSKAELQTLEFECGKQK
ncbi:hypothetical protein N481_00025 [Pseudoalteromonas luteoviolacea S4047-1]|uniref:Uncharacterized protein n=1 Tax=Pseudoalteromonas luteoviolacea S4054 TaxID=1129367 RepID=A0A0F6A866_9GAMM|nr:hypothetical protein N479_22160 [Pseudoalteromonas luteoviolacea S4054]KZN78860.1 hypothetical protein N481_00025 [Pseudoalteromonas luteoviolacea S4047-1]